MLVPSSWQVQDARSALRTIDSIPLYYLCSYIDKPGILTPIFYGISGVYICIVQLLLPVPFHSVPDFIPSPTKAGGVALP